MKAGESLAGFPLGWLLLATVFFVLLNGFFVAAEFALVKVRATRLESLVRKGSRRAEVTYGILGSLDRYLSACQLGITMASLILGWLAEPAVAGLIVSLAGGVGMEIPESGALRIISLGLALAIVTTLHMTVGEQAPKMWAIHRPEPMALFTAYPLRLFASLFRPFIWLINSISNAMVRLVGISGIHEQEGVHDVDELRAVLRAASKAGHISARQSAFGENVLGLMGLQVRHIMLPRVDVTYLSTSRSLEENLRIVRESRHTRLPLCDPDLDHVAGLIHGKDILARLIEGKEPVLGDLARPVPSVPDTQPLGRLILDLQHQQTHCALVVDEHGTTVGVAFFEDALEEIVGPIHDEFDRKVPWVHRADADVVELAGSVPLPEAADILDLEPASGEDTIGGYVTSVLGTLPREGDVIDIPPYRATILGMSRRRVTRVRFDR